MLAKFCEVPGNQKRNPDPRQTVQGKKTLSLDLSYHLSLSDYHSSQVGTRWRAGYLSAAQSLRVAEGPQRLADTTIKGKILNYNLITVMLKRAYFIQ